MFCSEVGGVPDDGPLRDRFYAALDVAGLRHLRRKPNPIRFHDLRHTFGTLAVGCWPLHDVQAYMGHADIQITMLYVHHVPRTSAADELTRHSDQLSRLDGLRSGIAGGISDVGK